jgi:glycerol-3-phosphate dehydrogenase (NAD(P)+)
VEFAAAAVRCCAGANRPSEAAMPDIAVIGAGGWGTAMAVTLAHKPGVRVRLLCTQEESGRQIIAARENVRLLPGVPIPEGVTVTLSAEEALTGADCWLVAVPTASCGW